MSYIWNSVLKGSFDGGFLIEESSGKILHHNKSAQDLFWPEDNTPSDKKKKGKKEVKETRTKIDDFVSFWAFSLKRDDSDDDSDDGNRKKKDKEESDTLKWHQVVKHYNSVSPSEAVEEWKITGNKTYVEGDKTEKRNFPGSMKLTCVGANSGYWLAFVRHADLNDMARGGSVNESRSTTGLGTERVKRSRGSGVKNPKEARMSIDADGNILEINFHALDLDVKNPKYSWINLDLVGKHLSTTPIAQPPGRSQTPPPPERKAPKMLDMILESGVDAGHASCPMSGFPLRLQDGQMSAMTTGGTQREENITAAAFEAALDPIFQIDEHGKIQMCNSSAVQKFGWKRSEFLGSNINMICGDGHGPKHSGYLARYLATGETRVIGKQRELMARKKNGEEFPVELAVVEVDTFAGETRLFCGFVRDLSTIKAREQLAQEMVKGALDPVFQINDKGKILMVNNAALERFGYEEDEILGHNIRMICGGSHGPSHDQYLRKYMRTGDTRVIGKYRELPAKRKDGVEFLIQLAVVEIHTGKSEDRLFCGFVHDLSAQKRAQEIMRGTIDTSLDPVLHINDNGIIQMVNNATCTHLGWKREELVGENVSVIVGGGHAQGHGKYIERYLETGEKRAMGKKRKLKARRKDGSELDIELGLSEININGGKERMFCAFLTVLSADRMHGNSGTKSVDDASNNDPEVAKINGGKANGNGNGNAV